jgi:hypothetical protein
MVHHYYVPVVHHKPVRHYQELSSGPPLQAVRHSWRDHGGNGGCQVHRNLGLCICGPRQWRRWLGCHARQMRYSLPLPTTAPKWHTTPPKLPRDETNLPMVAPKLPTNEPELRTPAANCLPMHRSCLPLHWSWLSDTAPKLLHHNSTTINFLEGKCGTLRRNFGCRKHNFVKLEMEQQLLIRHSSCIYWNNSSFYCHNSCFYWHLPMLMLLVFIEMLLLLHSLGSTLFVPVL